MDHLDHLDQPDQLGHPDNPDYLNHQAGGTLPRPGSTAGRLRIKNEVKDEAGMDVDGATPSKRVKKEAAK